MSEHLSFENIAKCVARTIIKTGDDDARVQCERFERNIAWDRHKLFARAQEIAKEIRQ